MALTRGGAEIVFGHLKCQAKIAVVTKPLNGDTKIFTI